jgi:hypothetical protein
MSSNDEDKKSITDSDFFKEIAKESSQMYMSINDNDWRNKTETKTDELVDNEKDEDKEDD